MKNRIVTIVLYTYFSLSLLILIGFAFHWSRYEDTPEQPIVFSHEKHAGELKLPCALCHAYAERGKHAGVPAVKTCMNCHKSVAADRPEIQKLTEYWNQKEPVPWAQVYKVKSHVYFTHKRHIKAGLDCTTCHGEVATMEKMTRVSSLKMGWCVDCHRSRQAPLDCYTCHK